MAGVLQSALELLFLFSASQVSMAVFPTYIGNGLNEIVERNDVIEHFAFFLWNLIEFTPVKVNS